MKDKKEYLTPEIKVVEIEVEDIIATSTQTDAFGIPVGTGYDDSEPW